MTKLYSRAAPLLGLAALAGLAGLAAPARAQLVTNGDFETADFTGWTLSGNAHYTATPPDTFVFGDPHSGTYAAWLGPAGADGFLSQSVATTAGHAYTVSYWLAVDTSAAGLPPANDFSASFGGQSLFSGTDLAATDGHATPDADYVLYSFTTAAATGPASALTFGFRDDPSEFRLDDVQVTDLGRPVPEASGAASLGLLLALGLGGVLNAARKKKA